VTKRHFIELADKIRVHNAIKRDVWGKNAERMTFNAEQIEALADFCAASSPNFNREHWLSYVAGECGPNGGKSGKK